MKLCKLRINSTSWKEVKTRAVSSELLTSRESSGGVHRQVSPSCSVTHGSVQSETTGGSPHWKTSDGKILLFCPQRTFKSTHFVTAVLRQINRWLSVFLVSVISQCCITKWGILCMVQQKKKKKKKKSAVFFEAALPGCQKWWCKKDVLLSLALNWLAHSPGYEMLM